MRAETEALAALVAEAGSAALVSNLSTTLRVAEVGGFSVPCTQNDGLAPTCYLNTPSRAFIDYGKQELDRFTANGVARAAGRMALSGAHPVVRATGLDRQVQFNNWMVATNILPPATAPAWLEAFARVPAGFVPVLRSVNRRAHGALLDAFAAAGLTLLPMRRIFLRDYGRGQDLTTDEAKDARLLARDDLERRSGLSFSAADFERAAHLYALLYLEKYSQLNPVYTATFLAQAQAHLGLKLEGLFQPSGGPMVGIIGRFEQYGTLTGPIVGYDTALPQNLGLYRRLRAINHGHARENRWLYNMSAGAEDFKSRRGGAPTVEYMIADFRRASRTQRLTAWSLQATLNAAASRLF